MDTLFGDILPASSDYDENQIYQAILDRVIEMLDTQPQLLMSYLYRLDVLEKDIKAMLDITPNAFVAEGFAKLIWERQKQRIILRERFKQPKIDDEF